MLERIAKSCLHAAAEGGAAPACFVPLSKDRRRRTERDAAVTRECRPNGESRDASSSERAIAANGFHGAVAQTERRGAVCANGAPRGRLRKRSAVGPLRKRSVAGSFAQTERRGVVRTNRAPWGRYSSYVCIVDTSDRGTGDGRKKL